MNEYLEKYKRTPLETSPREVESWALLNSANLLLDAKANPDDFEGAMAALRSNLVLWTIFEAAVTEPDNRLPHEIKENIINLTRFIDKHTFNLFAKFDPEKVDILVNINRNIAAGLAANADAEESAEPLEPAPALGPAPAGVNANGDDDVRPSGGLVIDA